MRRFVVPESLAISDSGFLFFPNTGETFTVNPSGRKLITLLKEGYSEEEIISRMAEEFDADKLDIERDMHDFIGQLQSLSLLTEKI